MRKRLLSPAKINLGLSIVGRRDNGFHSLESLFWPLSFGDLLEVEKGTGRTTLSWSPDAPFTTDILPTENNNIVTAVLRALPESESSWDVHINKSIPMGGGMGGGSSNVGTFLRYLKEKKILSVLNLESWASQYGADIPFFLHSKPAWVSGIGEVITPLECTNAVLTQLHFLLIIFPFGCETQLIFKKYKESGKPFSNSQNPFPDKTLTIESIRHYLKSAKNDLEPTATTLYPTIKKVLEKLRAEPCLYAGLSGSGATCFAVFESAELRQKTAQDLHDFFRTNNCKSISSQTFATR